MLNCHKEKSSSGESIIKMTDRGKVVAFIPVRGGSKSIPLKNVKSIAGKPLVQWVVEAACAAECIDAVYVSTDSPVISEIVEILQFPKLKVIGRSVETATDVASTESALLEFCNNYSFDKVFLVQATSPLVSSEDFDNAWKLFEDTCCDSLISVVRQKRFIWRESSPGNAESVNYDPFNRPRRQQFDGYLVENGAFYLSSREGILKSQCRISGEITCYEMDDETYYEIDEVSDWKIVEALLLNREGRKHDFSNIKMLVMDCDGVMTDAGMYYNEDGEAFKKFNTKDGKAVELLRGKGIQSAIVTGEETLFVKRRAEKVGIDFVFMGIKQKDKTLMNFARNIGISLNQIAYIGDDVNDLPAIKLCGVTACPMDASKEVRDCVDIVLDVKGGQGAVRAFADMILADG